MSILKGESRMQEVEIKPCIYCQYDGVTIQQNSSDCYYTVCSACDAAGMNCDSEKTTIDNHNRMYDTLCDSKLKEPVKLFVLFGDRGLGDPPEALEIIEEFSNDENPEWLKEKFDEKSEFEKKIVPIVIDYSKIRKLFDDPEPIQGKVV